jgi:hypothetical protein
MQIKSILYLLKTQETTLNAKIRKKANKDHSDSYAVIEIHGMKLCGKILRSVCNVLWMLHLLKISILVTKTPLTTLKCMPKAIISQISKANSLK